MLDAVLGWLDVRGFRAVRRQVGAAAHGDVLEIGAGTGRNLRWLAHARHVTLLDVNPSFARVLTRRAARAGVAAIHVTGTAEQLPFDDASFDTVVATLTLCSVDDPGTVLREIRRVLRPDGILTFAEHVRSPDPHRARRQDRLAGLWRACARGCHPNRDTLASIRSAGFAILTVRRGTLPSAPAIVRPLIVGVAAPARGAEATG